MAIRYETGDELQAEIERSEKMNAEEWPMLHNHVAPYSLQNPVIMRCPECRESLTFVAVQGLSDNRAVGIVLVGLTAIEYAALDRTHRISDQIAPERRQIRDLSNLWVGIVPVKGSAND